MPKLNTKTTEHFDVYLLTLTNSSEEDVTSLFQEVEKRASESTKLFGLILYAETLFVTPKMRQIGKRMEQNLTDTGRHIGGAIYGVNSFVKLVAKLANPKIQFGSTEEECYQILKEMFNGERTNHLPKIDKP
jgi:predicted RND superfamily exporter protein